MIIIIIIIAIITLLCNYYVDFRDMTEYESQFPSDESVVVIFGGYVWDA
jgi:hypothetical protein